MWIDMVSLHYGWGGILLTEESIVPCSNERMFESFLCHTVWEDWKLCYKTKKTSTRYCLRWRIRSARSSGILCEIFQVQPAFAHGCPLIPSCSFFDFFSLSGGSSKWRVWNMWCSCMEEVVGSALPQRRLKTAFTLECLLRPGSVTLLFILTGHSISVSFHSVHNTESLCTIT